jgi:hypothetical protein
LVHDVGHGLHVLLQVDLRAVVEEAAPLRIEAHEFDIIREIAAGLREDALQHPRNRQDGRPHVEAEAAVVQHRRLAAEPGVLVVQCHLVTARRRDAGGRQTAKSPADDGNRSSWISHECPPAGR